MAGPGVDGEASDEGAAGTSTEPGHGVQAHLRPERATNQEAAPGCGQSEEVSAPERELRETCVHLLPSSFLS